MSKVYQVDPSHSSVSFSIKHMMIAKVHGSFEKISGKVIYDSSNPSKTAVEIAIESSSINTHESQRDSHLKSPEFFDVDKYPTILFKSSRVDASANELNVIGDLTIHGVTKQVTLIVEGPSEEMKDPWGNARIGASGSVKIKRKDFGLTWNTALEAGGLMVGDEVAIAFDVEFVKQV